MKTDKKEKMNLFQKLHKIQSEIIGLGKNTNGHGYQYVSGSKVLEHIKPLMNSLGLILKQEIVSIHNERMDYNTRNGSRSEILTKLEMLFTWVDVNTGERDENRFAANGQNDWDKGVGSALTYGERYFLLKYFHINTDEDDIDNPEKTKKQMPEQPVQPAQPKKKRILKKMTDTGKEFTADWMNIQTKYLAGEIQDIEFVNKYYDYDEETAGKLNELFKIKIGDK